MPLFDLCCTKCGEEIEDKWLGCDEDPGVCEFCEGKLTKVPGGHFKLVYNNKTDMCSWGNEGYASSQYWKAVKEARDNGNRNVKGINEDW
ncbi:MAG: zinc ribbon domain-containing protein [Candidatus Shapirobacteria bacterium]